jgi:hypothetical protein
VIPRRFNSGVFVEQKRGKKNEKNRNAFKPRNRKKDKLNKKR